MRLMTQEVTWTGSRRHRHIRRWVAKQLTSRFICGRTRITHG
ncbi:hypothetical protein ACFOLD_13730 [Kocuria carniphila]